LVVTFCSLVGRHHNFSEDNDATFRADCEHGKSRCSLPCGVEDPHTKVKAVSVCSTLPQVLRWAQCGLLGR